MSRVARSSDRVSMHWMHLTFSSLSPLSQKRLLAARALRVERAAVPGEGQEVSAVHSALADQLDALQKQLCDDPEDAKVLVRLDRAHQQPVGAAERVQAGGQDALPVQAGARGSDRRRRLRAVDERREEEGLERVLEPRPARRASVRLGGRRPAARHPPVPLRLHERQVPDRGGPVVDAAAERPQRQPRVHRRLRRPLRRLDLGRALRGAQRQDGGDAQRSRLRQKGIPFHSPQNRFSRVSDPRFSFGRRKRIRRRRLWFA